MYVIYGHILNLGRNLDVVSLYLIWDRYILSASVNFSASRSHSLLIMKWWSSLNTSFHIMQHISKGKHLLMLNTSIKSYKPKVKENRGDIICPHQQAHQCRGRNKACFSQLTGQCPHCSEHRASLKVFQHNVQCSRTWFDVRVWLEGSLYFSQQWPMNERTKGTLEEPLWPWVFTHTVILNLYNSTACGKIGTDFPPTFVNLPCTQPKLSCRASGAGICLLAIVCHQSESYQRLECAVLV